MSRNISKTWLTLIAVPALLLSANLPTYAQASRQWVGTWAASPMLAPLGTTRGHFDATFREIIHITNGGSQIRLRFTNEFGIDGLLIGSAHVAVSAGGSAIQAGSDHAVTFLGAKSVRIPPGAAMFSDPVDLSVAPQSDVAVSFYLPSQIAHTETYHAFADQDNFIAVGDQTASASLTGATTVQSWFYLDGADVPAVAGSESVVAFGDSITDGAHSTPNANRRWPNVLADRLKADPKRSQIAVVDEGIGGNRILNDQAGPSALARYERDILSQDGVRYLIILESINDIGRLIHVTTPDDDVTAEQLENGLKQLADEAHQHGIKVYGATLTPYGGANYYSDKGEQVREAINDWILHSGTFDAAVDFAKATTDPQNPNHFLPAYDSGDHLHPNDAGYKAMGDSIPLELFK
jgi:lysophospholipase L1-like esterase